MIFKYGPREYEGASLTLCVPTALPHAMRGKVVELRGLRTKLDDRGKGHATALMLQTTVEADMAKKLLLISVEDHGLVPFYQKFAFLIVQREPLLMVRLPIEARMRMPMELVN